MNIHFYIEKLLVSEEFEKFKKENADAHPCGGFFVRDFENLKNPENKSNIDYFVPSIKKMFSFQLDDGVKLIPIEIADGKIPEKIAFNYNFDFDDIEEIILREMEFKGIKNKIQKILLSLQSKESKDFLVGTAFISGMGLLKFLIDLSEMRIIEFEKKSFFDMMNVFKKEK